MIVGITGLYSSGKDSVAEVLQKMNFYHVSFSDLLREEIRKNKQKVTREKLINVGNELREKYGPNVLARLALKKVKDGENYVFTSIRNPSEVELLEKRKDFILVNVKAPEAERLKRIISRNRENDPKNLKELRENEAKEKSSNPNKQQLHTVVKMAKVNIINNSSLDILEKKTKKFINDWLFKLQDSRPKWDKYFMQIAEAVKMRCNCMSAKKGAIVVKDKQILSTGYNGTPKGISHCNKGSCPRCNARHFGKLKSGDYSLTCICAHAEENAIVLAAYNGASTKGATLYTTFTPCNVCARMIINAGIKRVVAKVAYPDDFGTKLLREAGVVLDIMQ